MSSAQILGLGAVAGLTIFLGLPVGRLKNPSLRLKAFLSASATGILIFLLWDVLSAGTAPVERGLRAARGAGTAGWGRPVELALVFGACFTAGLMGLVLYDRWMAGRRRRSLLGPGAASAAEFERGAFSAARQLSLFIATGIGLHNFSEGLAIGQSAAGGELSLAYVLIIGFGLHNATEGFGVVAPLSGDAERPSWGFLALLGLIGGGPTFLGTLLGQAWVNDFVSVAFLALAAGSILYVVIELLHVNRSFGFKQLVTWGVVVGVLAGFVTDWVLVAAGA